jgi:hypothetical protein
MLSASVPHERERTEARAAQGKPTVVQRRVPVASNGDAAGLTWLVRINPDFGKSQEVGKIGWEISAWGGSSSIDIDRGWVHP